MRQIQCMHTEILMCLMDKVRWAEFIVQASKVSTSALICHISQVKNKCAVINQILT